MKVSAVKYVIKDNRLSALLCNFRKLPDNTSNLGKVGDNWHNAFLVAYPIRCFIRDVGLGLYLDTIDDRVLDGMGYYLPEWVYNEVRPLEVLALAGRVSDVIMDINRYWLEERANYVPVGLLANDGVIMEQINETQQHNYRYANAGFHHTGQDGLDAETLFY